MGARLTNGKFHLNHYMTYGQVTNLSSVVLVDHLLRHLAEFGFATLEKITPDGEVSHQFT